MHVFSKLSVSVIALMLVCQSNAIANESKIKTGLDLLREGKFSQAHGKLSKELSAEKDEVKRARLLDRLGLVMEHQGNFEKAQRLFSQSMQLRKQSQEKQDDLEDARSYLNLGRLYLKLGNLQKADGYLTRALETSQNVGLIKGGSIVSESQRFLAELHLAQGNKMEAHAMSNAAASGRRERSTKEVYAQKMAECLTSVARAEIAMGSNSKALVAAESAIAIGDSADRKNRIGLADRLEALAEVHIASGSGSNANEPANRTWELRKKELGSKHPSVARSLLLCGHSYMQLRDYGRAEKCYLESFEISNITLGDKHPQVAAALMSLACVHLAQGRLQESQNDYNRAIKAYVSIYGANHQVVAFHQKMYKDLLWQTEYFQEALTLPSTSDTQTIRSAANLDGTLLAASITGIEPPASNTQLMSAKHVLIAVGFLCAVLLATACVLIVPSILASVVGNSWTPSETGGVAANLAKSNRYTDNTLDTVTFGKPAIKRTKEHEIISFTPDGNNQPVGSSNQRKSTELGTSKLGKKTQKDFHPRWTAEADNHVEKW